MYKCESCGREFTNRNDMNTNDMCWDCFNEWEAETEAQQERELLHLYPNG
jgi:DNA-directed RNA polymerase subunit RPC12/RpoP